MQYVIVCQFIAVSDQWNEKFSFCAEYCRLTVRCKKNSEQWHS